MITYSRGNTWIKKYLSYYVYLNPKDVWLSDAIDLTCGAAFFTEKNHNVDDVPAEEEVPQHLCRTRDSPTTNYVLQPKLMTTCTPFVR